ncbi:hypothetical protein [Rhodopirellula baltica]|uniref:Glycine zipper domain-containing protein n=2 Tax=Rhodopirellula baltica TaxID=265606 RepID=Q7UIV8_RHOBA|nr:hypothetical protein [Rhodopirellula baltica]EGF28607.1 hypothetical protein RBWH47_01054 [Rhodopirellula baltica WH47]CAD77504.1 conserved hypothetical protein [Rhodopirellula baltica SH 1]HBE64592.1 hypothetical protein [Rhodopirellula baltica]
MSVKRTNEDETREELRNEDAITGEPGSHPVGTGVGAALGGAAAGAAAGTVAGPIGTVAGAIVGGVAGGYAGKAVAENIDPTVESAYWEEEHANRPYYNKSYGFDQYRPAYQSGWEAFDADANDDWNTREAIARKQWEDAGGGEHMTWEDARPAALDAYTRVQNRTSKPR